MNRKPPGRIQLMVLGLLVPVGTAVADQYEIDWYTTDGGGAMWSVGGDYGLGGTVGQPDTGVMAGGDEQPVG